MKWRGPYGGGAASGKAGAQVAARAKSTQYIRARVTPVNPRTIFQQAVRAGVKALSTAWKKLTVNQRTAWDTYGKNVTVVNSLGDSANRSGFNWFVGNNTIRSQMNVAAVNDAPGTFDLGNPDWNTVIPSVAVQTGTTNGTLTLASGLFPAGGTNSFLAIYASRPYSAGKNFFNGPYQLAQAIFATGTGSIASGAHSISLPFVAAGVGTGSDTGNQMQFVLRLARGDGRLSSKFTVQADN